MELRGDRGRSHSCLVFKCKCLQVQLTRFPAADGGEPVPLPWPQARVTFLLRQETGRPTSGGGLDATHSLTLENIFASGDRWPITVYPQNSGPSDAAHMTPSLPALCHPFPRLWDGTRARAAPERRHGSKERSVDSWANCSLSHPPGSRWAAPLRQHHRVLHPHLVLTWFPVDSSPGVLRVDLKSQQSMTLFAECG